MDAIGQSSYLAVDRAKHNVMAFVDALFPQPRDFDLQFWDGDILPSEGHSSYTVILTSPGTLRRMFSIPIEKKIGEAYIRGDVKIMSDDPLIMVKVLRQVAETGVFAGAGHIDGFNTQNYGVSNLLKLLRLWRHLPKDDAQLYVNRDAVSLAGDVHSKDRDLSAIQYHYDVSNDFYKLFLDERMIYSCAYFRTGDEDIDTAQYQKLDITCRRLRLQPGERLLDIGCGWGGLIRHAVEHYGVEAVGVTLSRQQYEYANQLFADAGIADKAEARLLDYRDLDDSFDKVVSIGMYEHVGRSQLPTYFEKVYQLLKQGGLFLNHGISMFVEDELPFLQRLIEYRIMGRGQFGMSYVFPDSELTPVSEVNLRAEEVGFEVRDLENWREHYAKTLAHWVRRLMANQEKAIELVGEQVFRVWKAYMSASILGFDSATVNVVQTLLAKPNRGKVNLPWSREDLYV